MADLMQSFGPLKAAKAHPYFQSLVSSIISQQVSIKAADSIYNKLLAGIGGKMLPELMAHLSPEQLRSFGVSPQKAGYLLDLSRHFLENPKKFEHLDRYSDEEVIASLIEVKGIGRWTAQMFLMFTLQRTDVFAPDDLGLKNAMIKLYGWKTPPDKIKLEKQAAKWSPHRTLASRYLWASLHNKPL
jgi:DNA-3-methyladenine glycosylase II